MDAKRRRIVVIGGGMSGLSAAYTLARARRAGAPVEEVLVESAPRVGGVVQTDHAEGCVLEAGPDSFLAEKPEAAQLARELGLGEALRGSNDAVRRTYILHRGRLQPLPNGLMLLVPTRFWPIISTPLLPLSSKLAMAREIFRRPPAHPPEDESVASFVRRHFGRAVLENIADPLLAGVYGGDSERLSMRSVLARFWKMERNDGSLTRATLRAMRLRPRGAARPPLFMTLQGGLSQLADKLRAQLEESRLLLGRQAVALERLPGERLQVQLQGGDSLEADGVILSLPAHAAGRLLGKVRPRLGALLGEIPYTSAMTVSLGYPASQAAGLPPGFGFLVPCKEKRRLLACTFVHRKFPGNVAEGLALLRCFLGGARDAAALELSDEEVLAIVRRELNEILHFSPQPLFVRIYRWRNSMAQYVVGHAARLEAIYEELEKTTGVALAGNAYTGIGISDCIRTGRAAAEQLLERIRGGGLRRAEASYPQGSELGEG